MPTDRPRVLPLSTQYALAGTLFFFTLNVFLLMALFRREADREAIRGLQKAVTDLEVQLEELWALADLTEKPGIRVITVE